MAEFQERSKVFESLSLKNLVAEGGFKAKWSLINPASKGWFT